MPPHRSHGVRFSSANGYGYELLPPPPYQTFNSTSNSKPTVNHSSPMKKSSAHPRVHQPATTHRDYPVSASDCKPVRRPHRNKPQVDQHLQQPAATGGRLPCRRDKTVFNESRRTVLGLRSRETFSSEQENRRLQNIDHAANLRVRSISRRNVSQTRRGIEAQSQFALSTVPFSITTRSHVDVEHGRRRRRRATTRVRFSISTHRKTRIRAWNANKENALRISFSSPSCVLYSNALA